MCSWFPGIQAKTFTRGFNYWCLDRFYAFSRGSIRSPADSFRRQFLPLIRSTFLRERKNWRKFYLWAEPRVICGREGPFVVVFDCSAGASVALGVTPACECACRGTVIVIFTGVRTTAPAAVHWLEGLHGQLAIIFTTKSTQDRSYPLKISECSINTTHQLFFRHGARTSTS
ncbi:hypothetical protein C8J57DRAFT_1659607 [Mycena rebaudengoi]|nr:hypothetical protein C8J57DRAFT_1659607 [Mycena rebaudengoi]